MDYQASTQSYVKLKNQKIILQLLINEGPMSRSELAKKMNSSKPTISKNVDDLLTEKKIIEVGKDDNLVGKKGTLLDINAFYGYVLSIDLSKSKLSFVLANLKKEWIAQESQSLEPYFEDDPLANLDCTDLLRHFIEQHAIDTTRIRLVTIAYPGVVGHNDLVYLTNLKFKETLLNNLVHYIKTDLSLPLIVKNDVNLATIAEKIYGQYAEIANIYLLSADIGVGAGIIINHQLYEGDRNAAGEVGFVLPIQRVDGRYFTLEERVSINALAKRYSTAINKNCTFSDLISDVHNGVLEAFNLYTDVLQDVSVAITNIASILDIKTVVVVGRLFDLSVDMVTDLNKQVNAMTPFETLVTKTTLDKMSIKGAISIGVDAVIKDMIQS